mgnify:CR=1 FL=1
MDFESTGIDNDHLKEEIHAISQSIEVLDKKLKNEIESQIPEFLDGLIYRLSKAQQVQELNTEEFSIWNIKEDENIFKPLMETFEENFVYFKDNENARNEKGYLKSILSSDKILILSPKNVDGDSLGSAAMLTRLARSLGKKVNIASPIDKIPHKWSFLFPEEVEFISWNRGKKDQALQAILEFSPDMVISPDTSDLDVYRFGVNDTFIDDLLIALREQARTLNNEINIIKLDHHQEGTDDTNFGSYNVVLPTAPSTGAMVLSTILKLNSVTKDFFINRPWLEKNQLINLDKRMRDLLAFTLISDSFGLERVRGVREFFKILNYLKDSTLHQKKDQLLNLEALTSHFQCEDEKSLSLFFQGINNAKVHEKNGWKFLSSFISLEELESIGNPNLQDAELLKSELGHLGDDIDFIILGIEQKPYNVNDKNPIKMTLRQSSNEVAHFHAGEIATNAYRGGGHRDTAGWANDAPFEEQVENILNEIGEKNEFNSFSANSFDLSNSQKSLINTLNNSNDFDAAEKLIQVKLKDLSKNDKEKSREISTAILSYLLEYSSFLQENTNDNSKLLHIIDACLVKGANYEQASHRLIKNKLSDLIEIKDLFVNYYLTHIYFNDNSESFAITYNKKAINEEKPNANTKKFISFIRRSTLSTPGNTQVSLIKFTNNNKEIKFKVYNNGILTQVITESDKVQRIEELLNMINSDKSSEEENNLKKELINRLL